MIGDRWGVTDDEVARPYPCDGLVPNPRVELWRGTTAHAPVDTVWRWLRQVQLAPYSYDWIDNLGRRSPRTLRDVIDPTKGQPFSRIGNRWDVGRMLTVDPGVHVTARIMGATMSYVLVPQGDRTRLLLKVVMPGKPWYATALAVGDLVMARKQLLNLAAHASQAVSTSTTRNPSGSTTVTPHRSQ
jgi:hypothetical protein